MMGSGARSMDLDDRGAVAAAVAALAYVSRGLLDYVTKRNDTEPSVSPDQLRDLVRGSVAVNNRLDNIVSSLESIDQHAAQAEQIQEAVRELDSKVVELLRMHRDPNSVFSTDETNKLLNSVLQALSKLEGRLLGSQKR